jgi:hypothetical protein
MVEGADAGAFAFNGAHAADDPPPLRGLFVVKGGSPHGVFIRRSNR